jgi:cysteine synthase A
LLGCTPIAILPEEMSKERFTWLKEIGAEVIATPGCESNVKEIYDKCWELRGDPHNIIFNQFEEFGNPIFHYQVTGHAIAEVFRALPSNSRLAAYISATGSAGTIAAGDYLKTQFPQMNTIATEAMQCPTLYMNGFGGHRIEGIGDKHIPWVHNVRNTDGVAAIDDDECLRLLRLFNDEEGLRYVEQLGLPSNTVKNMSLLGISSICNLLAAIKTAKYFELDKNDVIVTVFTDSVELYQSRLQELRSAHGVYTRENAIRDHAAALLGQKTDYFRELNYRDRKTIHNLKYYTWVEQQGKTYEEILEQWHPEYWRAYFEDEVAYFDELIGQMNAEIGLT